MRDWQKTLIPETATLQAAIAAIDGSALQIGLVVNENDALIGTVTDGDVRRAILRNQSMDIPVKSVMNPKPNIALMGTPDEKLLAEMRILSIRQIPIVDETGTPVDLAFIDDLLKPSETRDNWVVIMAGGLGSRLRPLTEDTPKPLLPVGRKPLLETILENFIKYNYRKFYFSVNYKSEMIRAHFGDGKKWNVEIRYIEEDEQLGTAGPLKLLPERGNEPLIIMNGDLLTQINFQHLLEYHLQHDSEATMCVVTYDFQVPFGVVHLERGKIKKLDEKPLYSFFVNAGIYVLEPGVIDLIPDSKRYDMTTLFEQLIEKNMKNTVFPIREYWLDVGRIDDLEQANWDFSRVFDK